MSLPPSAGNRSHHVIARALTLISLLALLWTGTALRPTVVEGQVTRADEAAVLLRTALDFEAEGRWEVAEALYRLILAEYAGTPAAVQARARLGAPVGERAEPLSRVELPVFGTLYGLWLGVAVPAAFGSTEPEAFGAGLLLGGPVGLLSARAAQNARPMTSGQIRAISWGGTWGTWQGLGWAKALDFGVTETCDSFGCFDTGDDEQEVFTSMIVGGLTGITVGAVISRNPVRSGTSSAAQGGSTWGSIYGAVAAEILTEDHGDAVLTSALLTGNAGLLAGALLARRYDVSRPRVRMINLGALVGGLGGVGIDLLLQPDDDDVAWAIPLTSSIVGLGIAVYATRNSDGGPAEPGADADLALLSYRNGALSLGTPLPRPTMLEMEDANGRTVMRPGLSVDLFRAKF